VREVEVGEPSRDLDDRSSIHDAVVAFYREVVFDDVLAPVFDEVAEVDWAHHIPKLIDYWCRVLLGHPGYQGALVWSHQRVHDLEPFTDAHFDRWLQLWTDTIDARWRGPKAERAKDHALRIATALGHRLREPTAVERSSSTTTPSEVTCASR
jgi:hemoglobin